MGPRHALPQLMTRHRFRFGETRLVRVTGNCDQQYERQQRGGLYCLEMFRRSSAMGSASTVLSLPRSLP